MWNDIRLIQMTSRIGYDTCGFTVWWWMVKLLTGRSCFLLETSSFGLHSCRPRPSGLVEGDLSERHRERRLNADL